MTPQGRRFLVKRLNDAPDLDALRRVWGSFGIEAQNDPELQRLKDELKAGMS